MQNTTAANWKILAILAKPERWRSRARKIVERLADQTAEFSDADSLLPTSNVSETLTAMAA